MYKYIPQCIYLYLLQQGTLVRFLIQSLVKRSFMMQWLLSIYRWLKLTCLGQTLTKCNGSVAHMYNYKARSNHQNAKGLLISHSIPYHCLIYFTTVSISPLTAIPWPLSPSSFCHQHHIITIIIWSPLSYHHHHHHHMINIIISSPPRPPWPSWPP